MTDVPNKFRICLAASVFMILLAFFGIPETSHAQTTADAQNLTGVWSAEHEFASGDKFSLTVSKVAGEWQARFGSSPPDNSNSIQVRSNDGELSFESDTGSFRGRFNELSKNLSGHWVQPATRNLNYPLATPVQFSKVGNSWVSQVCPMRDRIRMYLVISKRKGKPVEAFVRNPERNLGMRLGYMTVKQNGKQILFHQERGDRIIEGHVVNKNGHLKIKLVLPFWDMPLEFATAKKSNDSGFFPSTAKSLYQYQVPQQIEDGWVNADASTEGFDNDNLEDLVRHIRATKLDSLAAPYIHSVLISRNGKLVLEEYFYGNSADHCHDTRSAGKSVASMLVGAAMDHVEGLDEHTTLSSIFGDRFMSSGISNDQSRQQSRKEWRGQVTIGHALAMQSGLEIDDDDNESVGSEGRMQDDASIKDWVGYALKIPMARKPGTQSIYGSNNLNLAAAAVAESTKTWLPELFETHLAKPLQIRNYHFNLDPNGNGYMGGGIRLTARDQLKLGQVMLDRGKWHGKQVLSEDWVRKSLSPQGTIHERNDYCYGWWRKTLKFGKRTVEVFHASGNGGQLIVCIPEFNVVVQMSGGNYSDFPTWYRNLTELIPNRILSAIKDS